MARLKPATVSELFDERERAALHLAQGAGQLPNAVTDEDFEALTARFEEREILEIVGIISLFGFRNRWHDTLATRLEPEPGNFARDHLPAGAWSPGKHVAD